MFVCLFLYLFIDFYRQTKHQHKNKKESLPLPETTPEEIEDELFAFTVRTVHSKTYIFKAENVESMQVWCGAIRKATYGQTFVAHVPRMRPPSNSSLGRSHMDDQRSSFYIKVVSAFE